jgi:Na+-transporting methylmalonyl-CoA/oxaloacetate decarboxylase gamma subunit
MALSESILIAIFCMAVVFSVLIMLWGIIRAFSAIINMLENKNDRNSTESNG